jgi:hypothetical protein
VAKGPPVLPPETTLSALLDWLESEAIPGLIIGGIAASLLGRPRFTRDVDVLISLDEPLYEQFLNSGPRFGFLPRINNALAFARRSRVFLVTHEPTGTDASISHWLGYRSK